MGISRGSPDLGGPTTSLPRKSERSRCGRGRGCLWHLLIPCGCKSHSYVRTVNSYRKHVIGSTQMRFTGLCLTGRLKIRFKSKFCWELQVTYQPSATRRGFLAAVGIGTVGVVAAGVINGTPASAVVTTAQTTVDRFTAQNFRIYRLGNFRRGKTFTDGTRTFVVTRRRGIPGVNGKKLFDRNSFEVIFEQTRGAAITNGMVTLVPSKRPSFPLHLTRQSDRLFSAVINRYKER